MQEFQGCDIALLGDEHRHFSASSQIRRPHYEPPHDVQYQARNQQLKPIHQNPQYCGTGQSMDSHIHLNCNNQVFGNIPSRQQSFSYRQSMHQYHSPEQGVLSQTLNSRQSTQRYKCISCSGWKTTGHRYVQEVYYKVLKKKILEKHFH